MKSQIKVFFKYFPPLILLLSLAMMVFGFLSPWEKGQPLLDNYNEGVILLTGYRSENRQIQKRDFSKKTYTYLQVYSFPPKSRTISITDQTNSEIQIQVHERGLGNLIILYIILLSLTWYVWFRKNDKNT